MARSGKYQPGSQQGSESESTMSRSASKAARREAARAEMLRIQAVENRRKRLRSALAVLVALVVIIGVVVAVTLFHNSNSGSSTTATGSSSTPLDPQVAKDVTQIPASVYDAVGNGGGAVKAKPTAISAPPLTSGGKPKVLYVGAEYCPYCAAERWAVVAALSRFGTFSNLGQTTSSASDVYPSTATLSFHGSTYKSDYLAFTGVEQTTNQPEGNGYAPLDTLTPEDQKTLDTYDTQKYTGSDGGIPFIDFGGKYVSSGASYDPGVLKGLTHQQIGQDLSDPNSPVAKAIVGTANTLTNNLCSLTGQKPASVCNSAGVRAAAS